MDLSVLALLLPLQALPSTAALVRGPIIDVHLHAHLPVRIGGDGPPNPITGRAAALASGDGLLDATLEAMAEHGVVLGVASGPPAEALRWHRTAPERIAAAVKIDEASPFPELTELRTMVEAGRVAVIGEVQAQHLGLKPDAPALQAYFSLAAELDVPVAVHSGLGAPNTPFECCPEFRASLGSPLLLEPVLVRHPGLRVNLMHAGYPYLDETIALMLVYPDVYADLGAISWGVIPRAEFHRYLEALMTAGLGERLMFGSDQMYWPEAIEWAIEGVSSAPFLSDRQKADIFYNNAARFLRLSEEEIARHHRAAGR